ncbi:MAG: exopolysaccharide biosynthesis protein, partial [Pseudomonadota bacterium]
RRPSKSCVASPAMAVSPLSGVPFVTTMCGLSIAGLATQLLLGRRVVWLPERVRQRRIPATRLRNGLARADWVVMRMERVMRRRMTWLTHGPVRVTLLSLCLVFGLIMPFMEIVPFAGSSVAALVLVISLALISRDGVMALLAGFGICALVTTAAVLLF